jgi:hypothetical protein
VITPLLPHTNSRNILSLKLHRCASLFFYFFATICGNPHWWCAEHRLENTGLHCNTLAECVSNVHVMIRDTWRRFVAPNMEKMYVPSSDTKSLSSISFSSVPVFIAVWSVGVYWQPYRNQANTQDWVAVTFSVLLARCLSVCLSVYQSKATALHNINSHPNTPISSYSFSLHKKETSKLWDHSVCDLCYCMWLCITVCDCVTMCYCVTVYFCVWLCYCV